MASPLFTVIIPTRDRYATLSHSVASVLHQDFADFELIVVDNASNPAAAQTLSGTDDRRLRIVTAPRRLAMHDNWELGLDHARGCYVMFLGDDDAVLPDGLVLAERLLRHHPAELMTWHRHDFKWPDSTLFPGLLTVRQGSRAGAYDATIRLRELFGWHGDASYMTSIYHGLVSTDLIARIRSAQGGRYFVDPVCDIESEMLNAFFARSALACERPVTMNGHSGASNGGANGTGVSIRQAHARFAAEAGMTEQALVPFGWDFPLYMPTMVAGCQARVKERHFPQDDRYSIDMPRLLQHLAATFFIFGPQAYPALADRLARIAASVGIGMDRIRLPGPAQPRLEIHPGIRCAPDGCHAASLNAGMAGIRTISEALRLACAMLPPLPPLPDEIAQDVSAAQIVAAADG